MTRQPLLPGATLGVMGGGQLARMWCHAAHQLGFRTAVLDPDPHSPAGLISHLHVQSDYLNPEGLSRMAQACQAITTEFENVPAQALALLQKQVLVSPLPQAVQVAQDRAQEKALFVRCGLPVVPHQVLTHGDDLAHINGQLLPGILKTTRLGYDGKGQIRVGSHEELTAAWHTLQNGDANVVCMLEKRLPLAAECSVVMARGHDGQSVCLPVQINRHRDGILATTEVFEDALPHAVQQAVREAATQIAQALAYVGVLCVEFFLLQDGPDKQALGTWVVNEIAPRPHNSGHHSLDSCDVSQFDWQVLSMTGLPLRPARLHSPCVMLNLLGDLWWRAGAMQSPDWASVLALPGAHLHLYGKTDARPGRKMGHLTFTARHIDQARHNAAKAMAWLGMTP